MARRRNIETPWSTAQVLRTSSRKVEMRTEVFGSAGILGDPQTSLKVGPFFGGVPGSGFVSVERGLLVWAVRRRESVSSLSTTTPMLHDPPLI